MLGASAYNKTSLHGPRRVFTRPLIGLLKHFDFIALEHTNRGVTSQGQLLAI